MMHTMSDHSVLPFDGMGLYPQPRPRFVFKMPRVVPDQKAKFENDELFRRLSRECEVRYTGYRDRPLEERQRRFQDGCREGHTEIAFAAMGTNLQLTFGPAAGSYDSESIQCDFDKERGKVHLRSHLIMNGVCVTWRGWIDLQRLDGVGCLEYDEESAAREDAQLRVQLNCYNDRLRLFDEKQRAYRSGAAQPPHLNHHHHHHLNVHHGHHVTGSVAGGGEPHNEMEVGLRAY